MINLSGAVACVHNDAVKSLIGLTIELRPHAELRGLLSQPSLNTERYSAADFLLRADIPTKIDAAHAIAHKRSMIIDGETVITGSFNLTKAAEENNAENLLIIKDKDLASKYIENWKLHAGHLEVYKER